jgi:cytochrome d ubiquinol oxidase subunit I
LVISVGAYYLIKRRSLDFAKTSMKIGLVIALAGSLLQLVTGHSSAVGVAENQPVKMAAFEGHYAESAPADLSLFGWVSEEQETVRLSLSVPGLVSWLVTGDAQQPLPGLRSVPPEDRPPVNVVFQSYHAMIAIGSLLILLSLLGVFYWVRGRLFETTWLLRLFVISVILPQLGNQLGWISAEVGRQPWIVYGLLRTEEGISKVVSAGETLFSLVLFGLIYLMLFALFIFLLDQKIKHGPEEEIELQGKGARA